MSGAIHRFGDGVCVVERLGLIETRLLQPESGDFAGCVARTPRPGGDPECPEMPT